jgi:hypothetical protein
MPNNRSRNDVRKLFLYCLLPIVIYANPVSAELPETIIAKTNSPHISLADLQARFAKLQQVSRPFDVAFELRLGDETQTLMEQSNDGIVRIPESWTLAAPDGETLDFLMLFGLANAIAREPATRAPSMANKIVTGTLGYIAANVGKNRRRTKLPAPQFEPSGESSDPVPALRALNWTTITGGCEARIVAGLHKLEAVNGPIGSGARRILKALGPVAWTPNDRCSPPQG